MASIVGIAYNPGTPINNTEQYGAIAVSFLDNNLSGDYGGVKWWASPDLDLRYIIAHPVPDGSQPNPLGIPAYVGFWGSEDKTDESFLYMVNNIPPRKGKSPFSNASEASNWLTTNGYWNSYGFDVQASFVKKNAGILSRFYYRCDGGDNPSFIFIPHEDYSSVSAEYTNVIKWFDGNCYYKSDQTTYTNDYTVAAEWGFNNCDACLSDCTLDENIFTVNCKLIVNVVSETPPPSSTSTPTLSPTPTKTPPCINPDLDIVSCDLNGDVTSTYYSLRLEACCEEYSAQTNYSIVKYFEFSGISPEIGGVIVHNNICYEILLYSSVNSLENITIEPDPITYMFIGETPCITCIDNVSDCTNFETATPTPTPTVTPNFRDIITVRLVECCTGIQISTSIDVETSVPIYLNDVIVINNKCHTVTGILPYQGGLVISIDSNSHFSNSLENPCRECYGNYDDCGGKPTPTPTTSPTVIPEDYLVSARACCGNPKPYTIQLYLTSIAYNQLQPGDGIYYNDICYEIIENQLFGPIVGTFDENDIRRSICEYCCGTTPTSTPTLTPSPSFCVPSCENCGEDYYLGEDGMCYTIITTDANPPTNPYELVPITLSLYSSYYSRFYDEGFNTDGTSLNYQNVNTHNVWRNTYSNYTDGPLNRSGIWVEGSSSLPFDTWLGFSVCINITEEKTYYVGMGADNHFRMTINNVEFVNTYLNQNAWTETNMLSFKIWHVYPVTLPAGTHKIEMFGLNLGSFGSFGCEIYDNTLNELINANSLNDINVLFNSRQDEIEIVQDLNGNELEQGWTCDGDGIYNPCDNTCTYIIVCEPEPCPEITPTPEECTTCKGINMSFIVDITSSMGDTIDTMKTNIGEFVSSLESQTNVYSLGLSVFDEDTSSQPNYINGLIYLNLPSSQKIVTESNGVYQYHTSIVPMSNQNGSTFISQFNYLNNAIWFPLGWGNLDPDPVNESIKYVLNGFTNAFWGNPNDDEYNFISIFTDALPGGEDEVFDSLDESESEIIKNQLLNNNIRLLFFTSNQDTFNESPLTQISYDTGGRPFLTDNPIEDLKIYIDNLCCDLPTPTATPTRTPTPTISVTPTRTPTQTPSPTIPIVFDSNVEINFWFDDSGSASEHLPDIQGMVNNYLQSCLLPFYNNSVTLYNQRVNIFYMDNENINERGFKALSQTGTTSQNKVINIVFQDEANPGYHGNSTWTINNTRTALFEVDMSLLRNRLNTSPDGYLKGAWIHLSGAGDNQAQLYQLLQAVENGNGQYSGNYGLSDFNNDIKYHYWVSESSYYLTQLVINTINSFGYNIPVC